jgi:outer membrane protein assembly factor BamB
VLFGDKSGVLHSVDAITGDPQWQFTADAQISSTPVFANGTLYLASRAGTLYAIE